MNKSITISGQTIELPFTEAEYQKIITHYEANHQRFPAKGIVYLIQDATHDVLGDSNHSDEHDLACASVAIGLHLAEKEKQERIKELEFWNKALRDAVSTVIDGYHLDGMENMGVRDHVFYDECCKAMKAKAYPMPSDSSL
jgi:hypothetical protein